MPYDIDRSGETNVAEEGGAREAPSLRNGEVDFPGYINLFRKELRGLVGGNKLRVLNLKVLRLTTPPKGSSSMSRKKLSRGSSPPEREEYPRHSQCDIHPLKTIQQRDAGALERDQKHFYVQNDHKNTAKRAGSLGIKGDWSVPLQSGYVHP